MKPLEKPTVRSADLINLKVTSTDILNFVEIRQVLGATYGTPDGFIDLCLSAQDNRKYFQKLWGKPQFTINLETKNHVYQFEVEGVYILVWTSTKGTSIEVLNPVHRVAAISAASALHADIVKQLRELLPKEFPIQWQNILNGIAAAIPEKVSTNTIHVIVPYRWNNLWVFDDAETGLVREPFVSGIDEMLDLVTKSIPNAKKGFVCMFSETPFPDYSMELTWIRGDKDAGGGNWYLWKELNMEGWLCPALFRYFKTAPAKIYASFRPKTETKSTKNHEKTSSRKAEKH